MRLLLLAGAIGCGAAIGFIDSRPTWDDTGVTAAVVALFCGLLGAVAPGRPWVWGVAVGGWVPAFHLAQTGDAGSLAALAIALVAAYLGAAVGALVRCQLGRAT